MNTTNEGWAQPVRQWSAAMAIAALLACLLLASCGGAACLICAAKDIGFYNGTAVVTSPQATAGTVGVPVSTQVTVVFSASATNGAGSQYEWQSLSVVGPLAATAVLTQRPDEASASFPTSACTAAEIPASFPAGGRWRCVHYTLEVTPPASAEGTLGYVLSALFSGGQAGSIEQLGSFNVMLPDLRAPPAPDFALSVGAAGSGVYGTRATLPVSINRSGGFAEGVTLTFSGLTSEVVGSFAAEPVPTDRRILELQIPARYTGGGRVDLQVTATATGGRTKVVNFTQYIEPLFKLILQPESATLTTAAPLRIDIGVKAGDLFRTPSIGPVELSISPMTPLPPGVTATFLGNAMPVVPVLPVQTVSQFLQLVTDGRPDSGVMGPIQIRGTARGVPPDPGRVQPFLEVTLNLTVVEGQSWQFVGNNLTYGTRESNVIGMALQSDNRPVVAWLEGTSGRVLMRRYDGTTFAPSPPLVDLGFGLVPPALSVPSSIEEASFALTATDAAQVAFTYQRGATLSLGRASRAATAWAVGPPFVVGDPADDATPRARSPRVATGPFADAVVVSYVRAADAMATGGDLHVLSTFGNSVLGPLPGLPPSGVLNATAGGRVLRNAALALRTDGNVWVAWVEEPAPAAPPQLWLRAHDGAAWGPPTLVPTTPGTSLGASVQLLIEPSGLVAVAWLEGSLAQLMVRRYDPSSLAWSPPDVTSNLIGSLNVTGLSPALDVHLAREPGAQGRLLATWTEGDAFPRVWIKRREANGSWRLVGTTISQAGRWSKTPRIVSDTNNRLFVAWATYAAGQNPGTFLPYAEIDVAQWIFP